MGMITESVHCNHFSRKQPFGVPVAKGIEQVTLSAQERHKGRHCQCQTNRKDVRVEAVHASLQLRRGASLLEPYSAVRDACPKFLDTPDTDVLEGMLETSVEVWQELLHGSFILHVSRYTLRDFDRGGLREVTRRGCILHRGWPPLYAVYDDTVGICRTVCGRFLHSLLERRRIKTMSA